MSQRTEKVLVEIIGKDGIIKKRKLPIEDGKIIIEPGRKGKGGAAIEAEYDESCRFFDIVGFPLFRKLRRKFIIREGSLQCLSAKSDNLPAWTIKELRRYFDASVMRNAGKYTEEKKGILYLLLFIAIGLGVINLLLSAGAIRL